MANAPWHLEALGLPAHADVVAVRRAYAARLRQMDPATDPDAFQQLREAYEAARAWCDEHPDDTSEDDALVDGPPPSANGSEPAQAGTVTDTAAEALRELAARAATESPEAMKSVLDRTMASLRHGYVDAPGQFEDLLVDAICDGTIAQRLALFDAADQVFHWHEVGRLRSTDPRAEWIARILAQRETWRGFDAGWQDTWRELLTRAQAGIDDYVARRWPDIERLAEAVPDWLALNLMPAQWQAWKWAFDRLPASMQAEYRQRGAPASATLPAGARRAPRARWLRVPPTAWAVLWFITMLGYLIANGIQNAHRNGGEPLPNFNETPLTPTECMNLYARFDRPGGLDGLTADELVQDKRRAQRCALNGHWRAPGGTNKPPPH